MALLDLSELPAKYFTRTVTVGTVANQLQEILFPAWVSVVRVTADTNKSFVTDEGADGDALGANFQIIFGDNTLPVFKPRRKVTTKAEKKAASEPWKLLFTSAVATSLSFDVIEEY